ncbi:hypothetical protein L9H26_05715 [Morganella psychrotolerans]|uniref:Uncharacterized protein n=1 Tax=Morganella psychrotolerans TaxID=368603 RepID=A0A5M9RAU0_9GAMM|nr:hypothetical protein [Morganella psychrotolerans]KAA8717158.1 hypothetical protein F4V73_04645 [Morganella psychrotolerans]OBU08539.1 hypothetical protein AYY16_04395 [Morganella psychrotolerans]
MKKKLLVLLGFIAGTLLLFFYLNTDSLHEKLVKSSNEINELTPIKLDRFTTLENTDIEGKTMIYNYKISKVNAADIDITTFCATATDELIKRDCKNEELSELLNDGIKFKHAYRDESGTPIATIKLDKSDCFGK